ncbi:MAG TPA: PHB depolymerase family esterase [Bryobacteraceae bacterium]|nr:PHB depolymerase family esterase [Bryobacteraceae bacterium]
MADTGFLARTLRLGGAEIKYSVFIPHDHDGLRERAAILFLHGAGETGDDGVRPAEVGIGPAIRQREREFPFIVVFPQSRRRSWQHGGADAADAMAVLADVEAIWRIDARRVHLTGISMGGYGAWSLAAAYPQRWASLVPICGGGNPQDATRIGHIPCWAFHGSADEIIPVETSRVMVAALRQAGAEPRYTEYPGVGHNSWDRAYGTEELYGWLSAQSR